MVSLDVYKCVCARLRADICVLVCNCACVCASQVSQKKSSHTLVVAFAIFLTDVPVCVGLCV